MDCPVKYFTSQQGGAPVMNGVAGSLIALFDACLVYGFNLKTATSVVVVADVCTVTYSAPHGYEVDQVILLAGATPSGLNGEQRVVSLDANSLTFATTGISDQIASGTITTKAAPLGWQKVYTDTNLAVYRSADTNGSQMYLRVNDSATTYAGLRAYEDMTDVNTGTGWWSNGGAELFSTKSDAVNGSSRKWGLVGDSRLIYFDALWNSAFLQGAFFVFGDIVSYKAGDAYGCFCAGDTSYQNTNPTTLTSNGSSANRALARSHTQVGGSVQAGVWGKTIGSSFLGNGSITYPNPVDNALVMLGPIIVSEGTTVLRGELPGIYGTPHTFGASLHGTKVDGISGLTDRKALLLATNGNGFGGSIAHLAIDITGPWR